MMRLRRFAAALLGVLLLQVVILGAGVACEVAAFAGAGASVPGAPGAPIDDMTNAPHGAAEHGHHGGGAPTDAGDPAPVDGSRTPHPGGQLHCPSAMACATMAVAGVSAAIPGVGSLAAARIGAPDSAAPASIVGAPEPPPPRA